MRPLPSDAPQDQRRGPAPHGRLVLAVVLLGCGLRLAMAATWDVYYSFDFDSHLALVDWFAQTLQLPPLSLSRAAYHPPGYYVLAGRLCRAGLSVQGLACFGALMGCLRLALCALALERLGPQFGIGPRGRLFALLLLALLPTSLHGEVMVGGETLQCLLAVPALWLTALVFRREGAPRLWTALALGAVLGTGLLVKISGLMLLGAVGIGAAYELVLRSDGGLRGRLSRALPLLLCAAVTVGVSGWSFARNQHRHGKAFLTSFDAHDRALMTHELPPYLSRRPFSYYVSWPLSFFAMPYNQQAARPAFWPTLVASTWLDFYNYAYAPYPAPGEPQVPEASNLLSPAALSLSRLAMAGGTILTLATVLAWLAAARGALRRRAAGTLALLTAPLLVLVGQLHFATAFPFESRGNVKGSYMLLTAPVLAAVLGAALERLEVGRARALGAILWAALGMLACYAIGCRLL